MKTLFVKNPAHLARAEQIRNRIVGIVAEARGVLSEPEAQDPANAAQVATYAQRLAVLETAVAEETSGDWYRLTADGVAPDADTVIGALMADHGDAAPIVNAFAPAARATFH
jgi:hypothetical protein